MSSADDHVEQGLFTGQPPPRPVFPDLHGMLDDLIDQLGVVAERTDQPRPRGGRRPLTPERSPDVCKGLVDGGETPDADLRQDVVFRVLG